MSRCFPYPPPGYCRNGATHDSLIESIKLQKETDKSKSERKKEKRAKKEEKKEKKPKDKTINGEEKAKKLKKNPNDLEQDSLKALQKSAEFKEAQNKKTEPNTEQLERSDLSEEHGQPVTSHKPSYSSDSTQNSNKRKRDDVILPEGPTVHGKPIKIRLLKKQKVPDSVKETVSVKETIPTVPFVTKSVDETLVLNNRKTGSGVPATCGRENNAVNGPEIRNNDPTGLNFVREQSVANSARLIPPITTQLKEQIPVASRSRNSDVQALHSGRQPQVSNYGRPVQPERQMGDDLPGPSAIVPPVPSVSRKPNPLVTGKRPISELTLPVNNGPTITDKKKEPVVEVPKKVGPTRQEKKLLKKHSKYEKLIKSWVPPVLETQLPNYNEDEDWLSRKGEMVKSSFGNDVEMCRESGVVSSLWQPCARFLVEADMYAMPYTVPF